MRNHVPVRPFDDRLEAPVDEGIEVHGSSQQVGFAFVITYIAFFVFMVKEKKFLQVGPVGHLTQDVRGIQQSA